MHLKNKRVLIFGKKSFISKYLQNFLKKFNFKFNAVSVLKTLDQTISKNKININSYDIIFYFSFVKNPITNFHFFINEEMPIELSNYCKLNNPKITIFFISTLNIFLPLKKNKYIQSKKKAEKKILNEKNIKIIRIPLIISKKNDGDLKHLNNIINFIPFITFVLDRGSKINFIHIRDLLNFFEEIINKIPIKKEINLINKNFIFLKDICVYLSTRSIKIKIPLSLFFNKLIFKESSILGGYDYQDLYKKNIKINKNSENLIITSNFKIY